MGRSVLQALGQTYQLGGHAYHSSCSIGVALYADAHGSVDELLKHGDVAMYQSKGAGRNTLRFFDPRTQAADARQPWARLAVACRYAVTKACRERST